MSDVIKQNLRAQPAQDPSALGPRPSALQTEGLAPALGPRPSALQTEGLAPALGPRPSALQTGGLVPLTTIDYPGELAAVVFCQGCPWRCRYCQNGHLLARDAPTAIAWQDVLGLLERRRGLLDAVVFSGGEPTLQAGLADAIAQVRALGFKIGLHSGGCYPERLAAVLPQVDWVGLDIKALPEDYPALTGVPGSGERAFESLRRLLQSGVPHEVRVTVHQDLLPAPRLQRLLDLLQAQGAARVMLQHCRTDHVLDPALGANAAPWPLETRCPADAWRRAVGDMVA